MLKGVIIFFLMSIIGFSCDAQVTDSVYNKYLDFNLARFQGEDEKMLALGESILPDAEKLPVKSRVNFYFAIGKMYEDNNRDAQAIIYYEKVAAAVPDYYVVHRALGYLYLKSAKQIALQLNGSAGNASLNRQLTKTYNAAARKALPHLEKAQACDPSDETLQIITMLYKNIGDTGALKALDSRLKQMSQHCIDILTDG